MSIYKIPGFYYLIILLAVLLGGMLLYWMYFGHAHADVSIANKILDKENKVLFLQNKSIDHSIILVKDSISDLNKQSKALIIKYVTTTKKYENTGHYLNASIPELDSFWAKYSY